MAAVAGIAALAVVLVQGVVSDTSEQISGSSARKTAAQIAADDVQAESTDPTEARNRFGDGLTGGEQIAAWREWARYYDQKCKRIEITYGDAGISIAADFQVPSQPGRTPFNASSFASTTAKCEVE